MTLELGAGPVVVGDEERRGQAQHLGAVERRETAAHVEDVVVVGASHAELHGAALSLGEGDGGRGLSVAVRFPPAGPT